MSTPKRGGEPYRIYTPASFGQAIRHYREQAGLTQDELAERVGLDRSYFSRLETGRDTMQMRRILAILRELGVKITLERADW